jgi:CspA family cold shock protein
LSLGDSLEDYTEMARVALGTVKWFNEANGYGYIVADEGGTSLFVHRGSIVGDWRTTTLAEGNRVEFERREGGIGPEAIHVQLETGTR